MTNAKEIWGASFSHPAKIVTRIIDENKETLLSFLTDPITYGFLKQENTFILTIYSNNRNLCDAKIRIEISQDKNSKKDSFMKILYEIDVLDTDTIDTVEASKFTIKTVAILLRSYIIDFVRCLY